MKTIEYRDWLERSKKVLSYLIYKRKGPMRFETCISHYSDDGLINHHPMSFARPPPPSLTSKFISISSPVMTEVFWHGTWTKWKKELASSDCGKFLPTNRRALIGRAISYTGWRFMWFSSVSAGKFLGYTSIRAQLLRSQNLSSSLFHKTIFSALPTLHGC